MVIYFLNVLRVRQPKIVICSAINCMEGNGMGQKKFTAFYGIEMLITTFKKHSHCSICWARWIYSKTSDPFFSGSILVSSYSLLVLFTTDYLASYFAAEHCTCFSPLQCLLRVLSANHCAILPVSLLRQMCRVHVWAFLHVKFLVSSRFCGFHECWLVFKCPGNITVVSCVTLLCVWEKKLLTEVLCWYHRSDVYAVPNRAASRRLSQYHTVYCHDSHSMNSVIPHLRQVSTPICYGTEAPSSGRRYNKCRPIWG
jgi:hypothetical protein